MHAEGWAVDGQPVSEARAEAQAEAEAQQVISALACLWRGLVAWLPGPVELHVPPSVWRVSLGPGDLLFVVAREGHPVNPQVAEHLRRQFPASIRDRVVVVDGADLAVVQTPPAQHTLN